MKFLDEMTKGLQDKIDRFLEEHQTAVLVDRQKKPLPCYEQYYEQTELYRFLDKDCKETNFYLVDHVHKRGNDCGCNETDNQIIVREEDPIKIKQYAGMPPDQERGTVLFIVDRNSFMSCGRGTDSARASICGVRVNYDLADKLINKIRKTKKEDDTR